MMNPYPMSPSEMIERFGQYRDLGFTEIPFVVRCGALSHAQCMSGIARTSSELLPRFRRERTGVAVSS